MFLVIESEDVLKTNLQELSECFKIKIQFR